MKRTDIKAGVVYATKSSYGPPSPVVFLEDGAAGLYQREPYGKQGIRKLAEDKYTKAKRGGGWSETTKGYAAITARWDAKQDTLAILAAIDPAAELARFVASESPSAEGLEFSIRYTLSDIAGPYVEEFSAYEAAKEAERAADRRKNEAARATSARRRAIVEALDAYGIGARDNAAGKVELSLDEADKLVALLRAPRPYGTEEGLTHDPQDSHPSSISRLLAAAGHKRATYKNGCVDRGGFVATEAGSGTGVRVEHDTFLVHQSAETRQAILDRYAKTITEAGWAVEAEIQNGGRSLIVTAKEGD